MSKDWNTRRERDDRKRKDIARRKARRRHQRNTPCFDRFISKEEEGDV